LFRSHPVKTRSDCMSAPPTHNAWLAVLGACTKSLPS
jgi:hypothetical protein